MTIARRAAALGAGSLVFAASTGVAYSYGIQNHVSSGVRHGCPYDPGCTGATNYAGDYNRHSYTRTEDLSDLYMLEAGVYKISDTSVYRYNYCINCHRVDQEMDTNPIWECKYKTYHRAWKNSSTIVLDGHNHYTESAYC